MELVSTGADGGETEARIEGELRQGDSLVPRQEPEGARDAPMDPCPPDGTRVGTTGVTVCGELDSGGARPPAGRPQALGRHAAQQPLLGALIAELFKWILRMQV